MHAFAKDNFKYIANPLMTYGIVKKEDFKQAFLDLLDDYEITEQQYNQNPEELDGVSPYSIFSYIIPNRFLSDSFDELESEEDVLNLIKKHSQFTQGEWLAEDVVFDGEIVSIKSNGINIQLPLDASFGEGLRHHINSQVKDSSTLEWMGNADFLYCVWLPTVLRDSISQHLDSLNKRAAERYVRYKIGERVEHKKFGEAVVIEYLPQLIGDTIKVKFDNGTLGHYYADPKLFHKINY